MCVRLFSYMRNGVVLGVEFEVIELLRSTMVMACCVENNVMWYMMWKQSNLNDCKILIIITKHNFL